MYGDRGGAILYSNAEMLGLALTFNETDIVGAETCTAAAVLTVGGQRPREQLERKSQIVSFCMINTTIQP